MGHGRGAHHRLIGLANLIQQQTIAGLQAQRIEFVQRLHSKGGLRAKVTRLAIGQHHPAAIDARQQRRDAHHRVQHFFQVGRLPRRFGHLQQRRADPGLLAFGRIQARFVNGNRNLIGQRAQRVNVLVVEGRHLIALDVDRADDFLAEDQRARPIPSGSRAASAIGQ